MFKQHPWWLSAYFCILLASLLACTNSEDSKPITNAPPAFPDSFPDTDGIAEIIAPQVIQALPVPSSQNINVSTEVVIIRASFSQPMDPSTITADSFQVRSASEAVAGQISYSDNSVTFTPSQDLRKFTKYKVSLSAEVKNLEGISLATEYVWFFQTEDRQWNDVVAISEQKNAANLSSITMSGENQVLALWHNSLSTQVAQSNSTGWQLRVGNYENTTSQWQNPVNIADIDPESFATLATDPNGNALIVFSKYQAQTNVLYASYYNSLTQIWDVPRIVAVLPADGLLGTSMQLAFLNENNAIVAWKIRRDVRKLKRFSSGDDVFFSQYNVASNTWGPVISLDNHVQRIEELQLISNKNSNLLIIWLEINYPETEFQIIAREFDSALNLRQPQESLAQEFSPQRIDQLQLNMNRHGNALAIWQAIDTIQQTFELHYASFAPGAKKWFDTGRIPSKGGPILAIQTNKHNSDHALTAWLQVVDSSGDGLYLADTGDTVDVLASFGRSSSQWSSPTIVAKAAQDYVTTNQIRQLQLKTNEIDQAMLIWQNITNINNEEQIAIAAARFIDNSWQLPEQIIGGLPLAYQNFTLDMNKHGDAVLAWTSVGNQVNDASHAVEAIMFR